jgi:hypothetical protein
MRPAREPSLRTDLIPSPPLLRLPSPTPPTRQRKHPKIPDPRPISPKLHHIYGLPKSKHFPYVHKHEVEPHFAALRAGSPSPLLPSIDAVARAPTARRTKSETTDYSRTVFYPAPTSSRRPSGVTITQRRVHSSSVEIRPATLDDELQRSNVYRRRAPQARPRHDDDSDGTFSTLTTQTPSTVGGTRLELKGGSPMPRLRGGGGGWGYRFKEWLLTCRAELLGNEDTDGKSMSDLGVRRVVHDERATPNFLISQSPAHQPMPRLRGGAGEPERVPAALYWLAGGRGRPITVSSWKKQRGKKRMGGLLGMAVFGEKAGKEYASSDGLSSRSGSTRRGKGEEEERTGGGEVEGKQRIDAETGAG